MKGCSLLVVLAVGVVGCSDSENDAALPADTTVVQTDADTDTGSAFSESADPQTPPRLPTGYAVRGEATGDLDGDGGPEKVIVADTDRTGEFGREREVLVYRLDGDAWELWRTASGPVLPSEAGGTMGDPFALIQIDRGAIVIDHYGGSSIRWAHTHRFRYQNGDFYLIGATTGFGRPCVEWTQLDYNLSTGKLLHTAGQDTCDDVDVEIDEVIPPKNTTEYSRKPTALPKMEGFVPGENEVEVGGDVLLF